MIMNMKKLYGIFGGNFDPIHYGHIYLSLQLAQEICIEKIILLPNNNPPHRIKNKTSIIDKINMIKLAINHCPLFEISYLETHNNHIFYTIETLKKIREQINYSRPLSFIIGDDNLEYFHLWKDWKKILLYVHLVVCPRKNTKIQLLQDWIHSHIIYDSQLLHQTSCGFIFFSRIPLFNISSTIIRKNYSLGKSCHTLLPSSVNDYILSKKLY